MAALAAAALSVPAGAAHGKDSVSPAQPMGADAMRGAPASSEQRAASAAELASFTAYFQQQLAAGVPLPGATPPQLLQDPVLTASRASGKRGRTGPWQLSAHIDTRPRHTAPGLCHMYRSHY
ncbi:MAG: hypothetical protein ACEQSK_20760, partial [Sphingomonadaceae bacterium]